jgi:hypothetical protein
MANQLRIIFLFVLILTCMNLNAQTAKPVRMAIAGMTHGHVGFILNREKKSDLEIVGI